ncbi:MAG: glycosyltransferase [Glaciihabitans sp.]|nr:glycosyltransferase [Glaciihabitans sp.]
MVNGAGLNGAGIPGNRWDLLDGQWPSEAPTVSVIVVHYNQQLELDRTLLALLQQDYPRDRLQVVVVDDGSAVTPTVPAGVLLVQQEDLGFRLSAARNLGVAHSVGELLCFLDADTSPEPDYVRNLTRLPALAADAVTVGRRRHADFSRSDKPGIVDAEALALPAPAWLDEAYERSGNLLEADSRSYRYLIGAVLACSRSFFDELGGFDETFAEYGGEDWDWANRAWLAGAVFAHVPSAVAWHNGPDWAGRDSGNSARAAAKNRETLALADRIAVPGSSGLAVRGRVADVVVLLESAHSVAAAFLSVDSILRVLPQATVVVPEEVVSAFAADARIVPAGTAVAQNARGAARVLVRVNTAVRVRDEPGSQGPGETLRSAVDRVGNNGLGAIVFTPDSTQVRVESSRAAARARRWNRDDLFRTDTVTAPWVQELPAEPPLAAYLGGWD